MQNRTIRKTIFCIPVLMLLFSIIACIYIKKYQTDTEYEYGRSLFSKYIINLNGLENDEQFSGSRLDDNKELIQKLRLGCNRINNMFVVLKHPNTLTNANSAVNVYLRDSKDNVIYEKNIGITDIEENMWFPVFLINEDVVMDSDEEISLSIISQNTDGDEWYIGTTPVNEYQARVFTGFSDNNDAGYDKENAIALFMNVVCESGKYFKSVKIKKTYELFSFISLLSIICLGFAMIISLLDVISNKEKYAGSRQILKYVRIVLMACAIVCIGGMIVRYVHMSSMASWYRYGIVRHGGGSIDGRPVTNSQEAIEKSINDGARLIEVDFAITKDEQLVLKHEWKSNAIVDLMDEYVPTMEEFSEKLIWEKWHTTTYDDLLDIMGAHPDVFFITDTKESDYQNAKFMLSKLKNRAIERNMEECLKRFIVQVYTDEMFYIAKDIYDFQIVYTMYKHGIVEIQQFIDFCKGNGIDVVTAPYEWWKEEEVHDALKNSGLIIYLHTVNDEVEYQKYVDDGVYSVYSDTLL